MLFMSGCTIFGSVTCIIPSSICSSLWAFFGFQMEKERLGVYFPQVIKGKMVLIGLRHLGCSPSPHSFQPTHPPQFHFSTNGMYELNVCMEFCGHLKLVAFDKELKIVHFLGWRRVLKIIGNLMGNQKHYHWLKRLHWTRCIQQIFWLVLRHTFCALNVKEVDVMEEW